MLFKSESHINHERTNSSTPVSNQSERTNTREGKYRQKGTDSTRKYSPAAAFIHANRKARAY